MLSKAILALAIMTVASCERSNRSVDIQQPINNGVKPDTGDAGDSTSKTGTLSLQVSGLPASASTADLMISIDGDLDSRTVSLSGGSGVVKVTGLTPGSSILKVTAIVNQVAYLGASSAIIRKGEISSASVVLSAGSNPTPPGPTPPGPTPPGPTPPGPTPPGPTPPGPTPPGPTPPGPTPPNNDTSIDINIDIGPAPGPNPQPQNLWDGKSFKGNSMFNVEPIK
jgi:hypothetical protein